MNRHVRNALLIWLVLSAGSIVWLANADIFPPSAGEQAAVIDDAFRLLSMLAAPVAALVLTVLGYSLFRFRADGARSSPIPDPRPRTRRAARTGSGWLGRCGAGSGRGSPRRSRRP